MGFMNERQANKQAKKTLKKNQNYSRFPLTNDDNYIIMANITNNNTIKENNIMTNNSIINERPFGVFQTVVRNGRWEQDRLASFPSAKEAVEFVKRWNCGNPTTCVVNEDSGKKVIFS